MIFSIIFWVVLALTIFMLASVAWGVPFLPTHRRQAELMIKLAQIQPGMMVVDLGSGSGRLLFLAAHQGARAVGYEVNPFLYFFTKAKIFLTGQQKNISVHLRSLYGADVAQADVVLAFLFPSFMDRVGKKLFAEMKPGAKILSYVFRIPGRMPIATQDAIFLYQV